MDSILQRVSQLNFVRLEPAAIAELLHTLTVAIQRLAAENQRPHHAPVMDIIEKASKELEPGGFPPATLAHILWTWATLQQRPSMVTSRRVCTAVAASIGSMTPEQISTVAWCLGAQDVRAKSGACLGPPAGPSAGAPRPPRPRNCPSACFSSFPDLADALCKDVFSRIWAFSMDHLRYVAWAFRSLAYAPPPPFGGCWKKGRRRSRRGGPPRPSARRCGWCVVVGKRWRCTWQQRGLHCACRLRGVGESSIHPAQLWHARPAVCATVSRLPTPHSLTPPRSHSLPAPAPLQSAELGYQLPSPAMSALRREIASRLSDFTHEEMVVVLKAWAKVGYRDGGSAVRYCITELAEAAGETRIRVGVGIRCVLKGGIGG